MSPSHQKRWLAFWLCLVIAILAVTMCHATTVYLIGYVTYSLLDSQGVPLADGSWVGIFGSGDAVNDGPETYGDPDTLIADSVQGDDIFIGWVRIDQSSFEGSNGTFVTDSQFTFDIDTIHYLYLRFFDDTNYPPIQGSNIAWGTSPVFGVTNEFGYVETDFVGNYMTSLTNDFVIIPEPSTSHLLLLFLGLAAGMRASMKKPGGPKAHT